MNESATCVICLESLAKESVSALFCGHVYHSACVLQWTENNPSCPTCLHKIKIQKDTVVKLYLDLDTIAFDKASPEEQAIVDIQQENRELRAKLHTLTNTHTETCQQLDIEKDKNKKLKASVMKYQSIQEVMSLVTRLDKRLRDEQVRVWKKMPREKLVHHMASQLDQVNDLNDSLVHQKRQSERHKRQYESLEIRYNTALEKIKELETPRRETKRIRTGKKFGGPLQMVTPLSSGDDSIDEDDAPLRSSSFTRFVDDDDDVRQQDSDEEQPPPLNIVSPVRGCPTKRRYLHAIAISSDED